MKRRQWLLPALLASLIFAINVYLNWPLFQNGAQPYRGSIEGGYAGISRFFSQHPNPWGWNPFSYCGLPTHFTYLPGLPYLVSLLLWTHRGLEALHAYRIVTALFACLGPVTLFLFALYATNSRRWAFAAALGYTFCSPSYDLFTTIDKDRGLLPIPWRLHVMVKYGEGPHNAGLTLLPLALMGILAAARRPGFPTLLAAALGLAIVALTHWIAAFALALCVLLLMFTYLPGALPWNDTPFRHWRVLAAGALAYLLAAFWLTPTFIQTVAFNWPKDSFGYKLLATGRLTLALILAGVILIRFLFRRRPQALYLCFVTLCFFVFAALAESHYAHGVDPIPESRRYALEMELFLALALTEWMRTGWKAGGEVNRFCVVLAAALLVLQGVPQAMKFVTAGYAQWQLRPKEQTVEYRLAQWLQSQKPAGRVYVSGGLRFRLSSWFDIPQTNGTFDSGLTNRTPLDWDYRFRSLAEARPGLEVQDSIWMLQAMGVEYLVVHGAKSEEYYRDIRNPNRFQGVLQKVHEDGENHVYRVPFRSLAHLLKPEEFPIYWDPHWLPAFIAAINDPKRNPLLIEWETPNRLHIIGGQFPASHAISLLMSYDPGWRASQDGRPVPISRDALGYLVLKPPSGGQGEIVMEYFPRVEDTVMAGTSALAWLGAVGAWIVMMLRHRIDWRRGNSESRIGI